MKKPGWALAAGALAFASPLAAQDYDARRVVASVNQVDLEAIVASLGHKVREAGKPGATYLAAENENGLIYILFGNACDMDGVPGCQGVIMQVRYDLPEGTTLETLAKANEAQLALNITADFAAKSLVFTRYHVLDQGVTMANIRDNVNVLLGLTGAAFPIAAGGE